CAKLNREIVFAVTNAARSMINDHRTAKRQDAASDKADAPTPADSSAPGNAAEWLAVLKNSEVLSSKFTAVCIQFGNEFASKLAASSNTRSTARNEADRIERAEKRLLETQVSLRNGGSSDNSVRVGEPADRQTPSNATRPSDQK